MSVESQFSFYAKSPETIVLEVLQHAVQPANLIPTLLLGLVLLYWLTVIIGLSTPDALDFDVDGDGAAPSFEGALDLLNVGEIPVSILASVWAGALWTVSLIVSQLSGDMMTIWSMLLLVPNAVGALFVTAVVTRPFRRLFRAVRQEEESLGSIVGKTCTIRTATADDQFGQAELDHGGTSLLLNVRVLDGVPLHRGETALVVREDKVKSLVFIRKLEQPNLES